MDVVLSKQKAAVVYKCTSIPESWNNGNEYSGIPLKEEFRYYMGYPTPTPGAAFFEQQVLLGKEMSAQWAIAIHVYFQISVELWRIIFVWCICFLKCGMGGGGWDRTQSPFPLKRCS